MNTRKNISFHNIKSLSGACLSIVLCCSILITTLLIPVNAQAASGNWTDDSMENGYRLKVTYEESEQNPTANTSKVTATLFLEQDANCALHIGTRTATIKINGVTTNITNIPVINNTGNITTKLGTASTVVEHDNDGSKSISISATFNIRATIAGIYHESLSTSKSIELDDFERSVPHISISGDTPTGTSVNLTATSDVACSEWQYRLDNAYKWYAFGTAGTSNVLALTGLENRKSYTVHIRANSSTNNTLSAEASYRFITARNGGSTSGLAASNVTDNSVNLTWTASAIGSNPPYRVYKNNVLVSSLVNATSYNFRTLDPNTQYTFGVSNRSGANMHSITCITMPRTPTNLSVTEQTGNSVALSWNYSAGGNASNTIFNIYRGNTLVGTSANNEYTDNTYKNTNCAYSVRAVTSVGSSNASNSVSVTHTPLQITLSAENQSTYAVVTPSFSGGVENTVKATKWAFGEHDSQYFAETGTEFYDSFAVFQNGTYTVYAKDQSGNVAIQTVQVSGIMSANALGANEETITDMMVEAPGLPVSIERTYCSIPSGDSRNIFGNGWSFNFAKSTFMTTNADEENIRVVCLPDNTVEYFQFENNAYTGIHTQSVLTANGSALVLTAKDGIKYTYTSGYLTDIEEPNGNTITIALNGSHLPTSITDSANRTFSVTYNADNKIVKIMDPVGRDLDYVYDDNGNLVQTKNYNDAALQNYEYSGGLLSAIKDGRNHTIVEYSYNDRKQLSKRIENEETIRYDYIITNNGETVVNESPEESDSVSTTYSAYGEIIAESDGYMFSYNEDGSISFVYGLDTDRTLQTYTYDSFGNITHIVSTDENGRVAEECTYAITYFSNTDDVEREVETTTQYSYDNDATQPSAEVTTVTDVYDSHGNLLNEQAVDGEDTTVYSYTYNTKGLVLSETEGSKRTDYVYNSYGYPTSVTESEITGTGSNSTSTVISQASYTYNTIGQVLTQTEHGTTTSFVYDVNGNVIKTTQSDGETTLVERVIYDENDQIAQMIGADQYSAAADGLQPNTYGICQSNTYSNANIGERFAYDNDGNVTTYINKANNKTVNVYDSEKRLVKTTTYETADTETDGLTTRYVYDEDGNLIQTVYPHQYNPDDDLLDVENGQNEYDSQSVGDIVEYDGSGNIISSVNSFGEEVTYTYDQNGHLVKTVQDDDVTRYVYDGGDNLLQVVYPDQYVAADDLLDLEATPPVDQYANANVGDRYTYDDVGNVLTYVNRYDQTITNTYDAYGNLTTVSKPYNTVYNFGIDGRVASEAYGNYHRTYTYLDSQNQTTVTDNNGLTTVYQTNGLGQITDYTVQNENENTEKAYSYTYDTNGNILTVSLNGNLQQKYTYDVSNQLVRVDDAVQDVTTRYFYDFTGNIIRVATYDFTTSTGPLYAPNSAVGYRYNSKNQRTGLSYDDNGNLLSHNGYTLGWTGRQLTSAVNEADEYELSFAYNSEGIRTEKTVNGDTIYYEMDENNNVVRQYKLDGRVPYSSFRFDYDSNGSPIGFEYSSNGRIYFSFYYVKNAQGDIVEILDGGGNSVVQYSYNEWGKVLSVTGSRATGIGQSNPLRYRGYYYDRETALYYLQSRYYSPDLMAFISQDDPALSNAQGQPLGSNLYAYCLNNPVNYCDYTGNFVGSLSISASYISLLSGALSSIISGIGTSMAAIKTAIASSVVPAICIAAAGIAVAGIVYTLNKVKSITSYATSTVSSTKSRIKSGGVNPKQLNQYTVYVIVRKNTVDVVYVGMTKRYAARKTAHSKRFTSSKFTMLPVATGLTKTQARALEQTLISAYGIDTLVNLINSISPKKWSTFKQEFQQMQWLIESWKDPE